MKSISKASSENLLYSTIIRDTIISGLTENYTMQMWSNESQSTRTLSLEDTSEYPALFQLFVVDGSLVEFPVGRFSYQIYNEGTSDTILERGIVKITE